MLPPNFSYFSLRIDEAPEGVVVNKVPGDADGPATNTHLTLKAIIAIMNQKSTTLTFTVPNNAFGTPWQCYLYNTTNGLQFTGVAYKSLGGGKYSVDVPLLAGPIGINYRHLVCTFHLPGNLANGLITIQGQIQTPGVNLTDSTGSATARITPIVEAIYLINQRLLYQLYD